MNFISTLGKAAQDALRKVAGVFGFGTEAAPGGDGDVSKKLDAKMRKQVNAENRRRVKEIRKEQQRQERIMQRAIARDEEAETEQLLEDLRAKREAEEVTVPYNAKERAYYNRARAFLIAEAEYEGYDWQESQAEIEQEAKRQREAYYSHKAEAIRKEIARTEERDPRLSNPRGYIRDINL